MMSKFIDAAILTIAVLFVCWGWYRIMPDNVYGDAAVVVLCSGMFLYWVYKSHVIFSETD